MPFAPRESQTRIKHEILHAYVGGWAGIITQGILGRVYHGTNVPRLQLVYMDAFAGAGAYDGEADESYADLVWGSPIIGMQALEGILALRDRDRLAIDLSGLAIEQDAENYRELVHHLQQSGLKTPVSPFERYPGRDALGLYVVINDDAREHIHDALQSLHDDWFLLAFLDPYGLSLPLEMVRSVVTRNRTDTIVYFPTSEVQRKSASARKPAKELDAAEHTNLALLDRLFGGVDDWRAIAQNEGMSAEQRVKAYVGLYRELLEDVLADGVVKEIGLRFSKTETTGYHLFLTTRNADGALKMNEILRNAEYREHWTLYMDRQARLRARDEARYGLSLDLGVGYGPRPPEEVERPSREEVERSVQAVLSPGEHVALTDLLGRLVGNFYTRSEILSALNRLRKKKELDWDGEPLRNNGVIHVRIA